MIFHLGKAGRGDFGQSARAIAVFIGFHLTNRFCLHILFSNTRTDTFFGGVAQLGEHNVRNVGVESSNLFASTNCPSMISGGCKNVPPEISVPEKSLQAVAF